MTKDQILIKLNEKGLKDILELVEDAESGDLEELELVESVGLVHDNELNEAVLALLRDLGVEIIYITFDDDGEEEEA